MFIFVKEACWPPNLKRDDRVALHSCGIDADSAVSVLFPFDAVGMI